MKHLKVVRRLPPEEKDNETYLETEELKILRTEARKAGLTLTEYIKSLVRFVSVGRSDFKSLG